MQGVERSADSCPPPAHPATCPPQPVLTQQNQYQTGSYSATAHITTMQSGAAVLRVDCPHPHPPAQPPCYSSSPSTATASSLPLHQ